MEVSRTLKNHPELQLRMGIHSGPVSGVIDVTGKANVAGAGINMAQRVMDCGDAGHILLSKHVAEDLEQYPHWQPYLHELGECEVKHGVRVSVVNLYTEELGNPAVPDKLKAARAAAAARRKRAAFRRLSLGALALLAVVGATGFLFFRYKGLPAAVELAIPAKSVAVLPLENLTEEKENAYFADGILRGRAFEGGSPFDKSNVERTIHSYQEAVKLDPNFALAWAYLSRAQSVSYWVGHDPSPARLAAAKDAADRALALDPNLAETHLALGYYRYYGQQDFTGGLAEFPQAEKNLPNNVQRAGGKVRVNAQLVDKSSPHSRQRT